VSIFFDTQESLATTYELKFANPSGVYLNPIDDYLSLVYSMVVGDIGEATLIVPGTYDKSYFVPDSKLEIWRKVGSYATHLEGDRVWFLRGLKTVVDDTGVKTYELRFKDSNELLKTRIIAYSDSTSYTVKADNADDMMKAAVRENIGPSAVDTARINVNISVDADLGLGVSITKDFARNVLIEVLKSIAEQSMQESIDSGNVLQAIFFDLVCTNPVSNTFVFRTFAGYRGNDRRSSTSQGVLIGPKYRNIGAYTIDEDWSEEVTYVYVGGAGEEDVRVIGTASDAARIGRSFIGRREGWIESRDTVSQTALNAEGDAWLIAHRPRRVVEATFTDQPGSTYGVNLFLGDYITFESDDLSLDMRLNAVTVTVGPSGEDKIDIALRGNI